MNTVTARARRPLSFAMFADMLDAHVLSFTSATDKRTTVTFDRDLEPDETAAVTARITSSNDADMADREALWQLVAEVDAMPATPVRDLLVRVVTRVLDA